MALHFLRVLRTLHLIRQPDRLTPSPQGEGFFLFTERKICAIIVEIAKGGEDRAGKE